MPAFVQHRMHERCIDRSYLPLLRRVDRFIQQVATQRDRREKGLPPELDSLREYEASIHRQALERAGSGTPIDERVAIEAFAAGVLRALHYQDTVSSGLPLLDLAGSQTMRDFRVDLPPGSAPVVIEALQRAFGLDATELERLRTDLQDELELVDHRRRLIAALAALHPLEHDPDRACHALFTALFPGNPLRVGEIRLVRTGTSVFLTVPFKAGKLLQPSVPRTADELPALTAFLERLAQFEQPYLANFPVFGCFHARDADPGLLDGLIAGSGLDRDTVVRTLTTMVNVIPLAELDQYLVHDTWGHQWQALLYAFESRYQDASRYRQPPPPDAGYGPQHLSLLDGARAYAATGSFDVFDGYLKASFAHRVTTTLSGLFAEVLADAVEYKFLAQNPDKRALMPSSSFFKDLPAKLDLTLHDLPWYFGMAQRGFERLAFDEAAQQALTESLCAAGVPEAGVVTAALTERLASWLDGVHRAELQYDPSDEGVYLNVFARVALHFAQLHAVMNDLYIRLAQHELHAPLGHFGDLLVFATASYFERDPTGNFWTTDDFLQQWFEPLLLRFDAALPR